MKRTRKLCAIMIDSVGRELIINRPTQDDEDGWPTFEAGIAVEANQKASSLSLPLSFFPLEGSQCFITKRGRRLAHLRGRHRCGSSLSLHSYPLFHWRAGSVSTNDSRWLAHLRSWHCYGGHPEGCVQHYLLNPLGTRQHQQRRGRTVKPFSQPDSKPS